MNYDYNGNLIFEEKIASVTKDITSKYPEVSLEKAKFIAVLEEPITNKVDYSFKIKRLYYIMLLSLDDKKFQNKVYKDILKIYKNEIGHNDKIDTLIKDLNDYFENDSVFPLYNEN